MKLQCPGCGETGRLVWEYWIYPCEKCKRYFASDDPGAQADTQDRVRPFERK